MVSHRGLRKAAASIACHSADAAIAAARAAASSAHPADAAPKSKSKSKFKEQAQAMRAVSKELSREPRAARARALCDVVRILASFGAGQSVAAVRLQCASELRGLDCTLRGLVIFAGVHGLLRWRRETLRPVLQIPHVTSPLVATMPQAVRGIDPRGTSSSSIDVPEQLRAMAALVFPGSRLAI